MPQSWHLCSHYCLRRHIQKNAADYSIFVAGPFLSLRSPLGATPALLDKEASAQRAPSSSSGGSQPAPEVAQRSYQRYARSRQDLLRASSKLRLQTRAVDFSRVWCDSGMRGASREGMSLWRPNPPPGYVALSALSHIFSVCWSAVYDVLEGFLKL